MRRLFFGPIVCLSLLLAGAGASAQSTTAPCGQSSAKSNTLYCMPIISTEAAYRIPAASSENFVIQQGFIPVTSTIGTQLSTLPTPTPASGLIFSFGPGGLTAERELGPIFSNAPWTVGKHKLYVAFAYQYFEFDKIDNVSFSNIPLELNACIGSPRGPACGPFVQTNSKYSIKLNEYISYVSFGLTNRIDVSATIPIVHTSTAITTTCSVCFQALDYSVGGVPATLGFTPNSAKGSSAGIGDIVFSMKATVVKKEKTGVAAGVDFRAPTGDAYNFRGAGTFGARPYLSLGYRARFSPHVNAGFLINGDSILASQNGSAKSHLSNSFDYSAGADLSIARSLSVSADFIGQTFFGTDTVAIDQSGLALHTSTSQTFNTNAVGLGMKFLPIKRLLISANVLISVDNNGLHYKPSPMGGISYTF